MSDHDDTLPMLQMLEHAREAVETIRGRARSEVMSDRLLQLALAHLVLVVGEAASRVSAPGRDRYPDVPWAKAIGTRNFIAHGYDRIDYGCRVGHHCESLSSIGGCLGAGAARQDHVMRGTIDKLIISSLEPGRRSSGYVVATASSK
jgi:uncharacterized protein with HEPN domain